MRERNSLIPALMGLVLSTSVIASEHKLIVKWNGTKDHKGCRIGEVVFEALQLYEAKCDDNGFKRLKRSRADNYIMNAPISRRNRPSDPRFNELWNLNPQGNNAHIDALSAWKRSVGTRSGIGAPVVAVIDGGVDVSHVDLEANIWRNEHEIPGNGIDDDKNGYVDDYFGWNAYRDNGEVDADFHGTHVAGIIGAEGDNGIGVVGVNWKTKIMSISGSSGDTATVLKAYNYVLKQKKIYLDSKGKRGANVVSTNSSFGVDLADCKTKDYRLWNDVYNELGKAGILNAAATINDEVNVDNDGDVPTGCSSDFLITVTNTNVQNVKYKYAGFGAKSIDLGAPGTDVLSTVPDSGYDFLTGTSMATPHVAGAVAFLYSLGNTEFERLSSSDPAKGALTVKRMLLESTEQLPSLKGRTVSGGRLNLERASQVMSIHK